MSAMMALCDPGDKVLVFSPFYENYGADAILSGAEPIYIPLVPPDYRFDPALIEEGFRAGAKAIVICNPSNPCGKVFTREELLLIGELATRYDAYVVTDEVYEHMVYSGRKKSWKRRERFMTSLPWAHLLRCRRPPSRDLASERNTTGTSTPCIGRNGTTSWQDWIAWG